QAGGTQVDEVLRVLQVGDAAGGLDLHIGTHVLCKEGHVLPGGAAGAEACGGLDILRAGGGDDLAHLDLLLVCEEAALDDDLQQPALAGGLHGLDLGEQVIPLLILHPAQVDDHVHLLGAVLHGVRGHEALGGGGVIPVGEADHRADGQLSRHILRRLLDIAGRDADAGAAVLHTIVADGPDLLPGGRLGQQSVVALAQNLFHFHLKHLLYHSYFVAHAGEI
ncbi:HNH endonuclease, partial [Dysosmobacter welbionis]